MTFKEFYILNEAPFRQSKQVVHIEDVPMFSVYAHKELGLDKETADNTMNMILRKALSEARTRIMKIGFPQMHANVLLQRLPLTIAGSANKLNRYMKLNWTYLNDKNLPDVIVHEWAHLWMYKNGQEFKRAIEKYYKRLVTTGYNKIGGFKKRRWAELRIDNSNMPMGFPKANRSRTEMADMIEWVNDYGIMNNRELWATGIEHFSKLEPEHRKNILRLMELR